HIDLFQPVGREDRLRWLQIITSSVGGLALMSLLILAVEYDGTATRSVLSPNRFGQGPHRSSPKTTRWTSFHLCCRQELVKSNPYTCTNYHKRPSCLEYH